MICTLSYWVVWALALADDSASVSQSAGPAGVSICYMLCFLRSYYTQLKKKQ